MVSPLVKEIIFLSVAAMRFVSKPVGCISSVTQCSVQNRDL